jgi:hypothetical protein
MVYMHYEAMSEPLPPNPADLPENPLPELLEEVFFAPLREVMADDVQTRSCKVLGDFPFAALCVLRVLQSSKSGRDFIQSHGIPSLPELNVANYFGSLGSKRRLALITATNHAMTARLRPGLRAHHDLLSTLPELDGWEVWAGDGHAIAHATHDPRNDKDAYGPVHAIYKLDLRTGWAGFIDLVRPTTAGIEHEITTLKRQDKDQLRCGAAKGKSTLMVYDKAVVDFQFAYNLKQSKSIYQVTGWKDNFAPLTVMPRPIDRGNPANALVTADETVYFNNTPGVWRRITATCPDSDELYVTLTNEMTLPPGVLNQVRRLRWNIEKIFNQHERKLEEAKAWTANDTGKRIQAIAICIAHNLLRLFGAKIEREQGIVDTKVIKAWHQRLDDRAKKAALAGRELPLKLYQDLYRPTEVSLQFIRWLRSMILRATCYREALALLRPLMEKYL